MYKLPFIILFYLFAGIIVSAQSPHGNGFEIDCSNCHTSENWKVDTQKLDFNHTETGFELIGIHKQTDCKSCHTNLEFSKVKQECFECHTDVHENTLGKDCESCHNSFSLLVALHSLLFPPHSLLSILHSLFLRVTRHSSLVLVVVLLLLLLFL